MATKNSKSYSFALPGFDGVSEPAVKLKARPDPVPLLHNKVFPKAEFQLLAPDDGSRHQVVKQWIAALDRGDLKLQETSLDTTFLTDIFGKVLGYRNTIEGDGTFELVSQLNVAKSGRRAADGALGFFATGKMDRRIAVIELKGAHIPLDVAGAHDKSPVDQAWDYANHSPGCRWVIVSNFVETRVFHVPHGKAVWQTFWLQHPKDPKKSLGDSLEFRRFCQLLDREQLMPKEWGQASRSDRMVDASVQVERDVTAELYSQYHDLRQELVEELVVAHAPQRTRVEVVRATQTLLDRFLFCSFADKRDLIRPGLVKRVFDDVAFYNPSPLWNNLQTLFAWIDKGKMSKGVPGYNGGLFRLEDDAFDLALTDEQVGKLSALLGWDFGEAVSVEVLGHIFEQSISDLEKLAKDPKHAAQDEQGERKKKGVFYTPRIITRFIVGASLGRLLDEKRAVLQAKYPAAAEDADEATRIAAELPFWLEWKETLLNLRVVDPACGSGAFLVAALDHLALEYHRLNQQLVQLGASPAQVDHTTALLQHNLFGVDQNEASVEIAKLSLWLKTAENGRPLVDLDWTIRRGNSVVDDLAVEDDAFDWTRGRLVQDCLEGPDRNIADSETRKFIGLRWGEKFDVVLGNPPYVRQEWLSAGQKAHWKQRFPQVYDGVADLFVYFFARALSVCKDGGVIGFITNNKWLKAGYGANLRKHLGEDATTLQLVDFGHAPIFEDADTFPCVAVIRKGKPDEATPPVQVCVIPRSILKDADLPALVADMQFAVARDRFRPEGWTLEPPEVDRLIGKIRSAGVTLKEFVGAEPYRGIVTGFNDAFVIDEAMRDKLVAKEPNATEIIKPYLRGQDVDRWQSARDRQFVIFARQGIDIERYPVVKAHLEQYRTKLEPKPREWSNELQGEWPGRKSSGHEWYELQSTIAQWKLFEQPKLVYQEIQFHPCYAFDDQGWYGSNKTYLLPSSDKYLLGVLNSPLMWWHNWRHLPHMKDEALTPMGFLMATIPIATPTPALRLAVETRVDRLIALTKADHEAHATVLPWLQSAHGIEKAGNALNDLAGLTEPTFLAEIQKRRPKKLGAWTPALDKVARQTWHDHGQPAQARKHEKARLEVEIARLVEQAYGLTDAEVQLLWDTAPPRMPAARPVMPGV
jgi:type I restriction-modification system DNA methylase subunit